MKELYDLSRIKKALGSTNQTVAIWGAYQYLVHFPDKIEEGLSLFLDSAYSDIQEAGLSKIADLGIEGYESEVVRIFRESEGQLKFTAGYCLSRFPNDFSLNLVQKWYRQMVLSEQSTRSELEAASFSFLNIDKKRNFPLVLEDLTYKMDDLIKSTVLMGSLLSFCETEAQVELLIDRYFELRNGFSDAELTFQLIHFFGKFEIHEWLSNQLSKGYGLDSIFRQCLSLFGFNMTLLERQNWFDVDRSFLSFYDSRSESPKEYVSFVEGIQKICASLEQILADKNSFVQQQKVVQGFYKHRKQFGDNIPKIIHLEASFLISLPIYQIASNSIQTWLSDYEAHLEQIANYYHSSLLTYDTQEEILAKFFPQQPKWDSSELLIHRPNFELPLETSKSEILWNLYRGEYNGCDIAWPSFFPNPHYSLYLCSILTEIYLVNFGYYIGKNQSTEVDYALRLFQINPDKKMVEVMVEHYEVLKKKHREMLYQTIEYIPHEKFYQLLLGDFSQGDTQSAELILFLSELLALDLPEPLVEGLKEEHKRLGKSGRKQIQAFCPECKNAFKLEVDFLYLDETSLYQVDSLSEDSVWKNGEVRCGHCKAEVPFLVERSQLDHIRTQARLQKMQRFSGIVQDTGMVPKLIAIEFPRFEGKTYKPDAFARLLEEVEQKKSLSTKEKSRLWMKMARLLKSLEDWQGVLDSLVKVKMDSKNEVEWNFLMGFAQYRLRDIVAARKYFGWIDKKFGEEKNKSLFAHFVEQARYYLETMDDYGVKRSRFTVITGKK